MNIVFAERQGAPRSTAAILADQRPKSSKKPNYRSGSARKTCLSPVSRLSSNTNNNSSVTSLPMLPPLSPVSDAGARDDIVATEDSVVLNVDAKRFKLSKTMYAQCDIVAKEFDSSGCKLPDVSDAGNECGELMVSRGQPISVQRFLIDDDLCYGYILTEGEKKRWGCFPLNKVSLLKPSK